MAPQEGLRLTVGLSGGAVAIPTSGSAPLDIPVGVAPIWAVRVPVPGTLALEYVTASPLGDVFDGAGGVLSAWAATAGVRAELALNASSAASWVCAPPAQCVIEAGLLIVRGIVPAAPPALVPQVTLVDALGGHVAFIILDAQTGSRAWVAPVGGNAAHATLLLSDAATQFLLAGQASGSSSPLSVVSEGLGAPARVWMCPPPSAVALASGGTPLPATREGAFAAFDVPLPARGVTASATQTAPAGPARRIPVGASGRAAAPASNCSLGEFADAAVWAVTLAGAPADGVDVRLRISYNGDSARVYAAASAHARSDLMMDHFFNGHDVDVPLSRFANPAPLPTALELRVLPQGAVGAPGALVYFSSVHPAPGAALLALEVVETARVDLVVTA